MIRRTVAAFAAPACVLLLALLTPATTTRAQDVPGIEICTAEKTMERRTSCLQSNVDFLQKTIAKLAADHQQKLDAANRVPPRAPIPGQSGGVDRKPHRANEVSV